MSTIHAPSTATIPHPGFAFLRKPHGLVDGQAETTQETNDSPAVSQTHAAALPMPTPKFVAQLIMAWLEACQGRRPTQSLRKGPFSPNVVKQLAAAQRSPSSGARLLSLHMQHPCPGQIRFCASVKIDKRVRAVAGLVHDGIRRQSTPHLVRSRGELAAGTWRIEFIQMI